MKAITTNLINRATTVAKLEELEHKISVMYTVNVFTDEEYTELVSLIATKKAELA